MGQRSRVGWAGGDLDGLSRGTGPAQPRGWPAQPVLFGSGRPRPSPGAASPGLFAQRVADLTGATTLVLPDWLGGHSFYLLRSLS